MLARLDTNGDGVYNPNFCGGDTKEPIKLFGHSWGGLAAVELARWIKNSAEFELKDVAIVATIDPFDAVPPRVDVPDNVKKFWNRYQSGNRDVVIQGTGIRPYGERLDCAAGVNCTDQVDLNPPSGQTPSTQRPGEYINHYSIIWEVESDLVKLLK